MLFVWFVFVLELLFYYIFNPFIGNDEVFAIIIIIFNLPFVIIMIARYKQNVFLVLFTGFFIRLLFMFWDIYGRGLLTLPHSGGDTEGFLKKGLEVSKDMTLLGEQIYGGLYSKVLGVVFYLGPSDRIIGQYINVLIGITTIILVWEILTKLKINYRIKILSIIVMAYFPSAIIFSSILLREAIISFLVVCSFYFFIKWYETNSLKYFSTSILMLLLGSTLHTGVIGILVGYIFMILFYDHSKKQLKFSVKSNISFFILTLIIILMNTVPLENIPFLYKFTRSMEDIEDLYNIASGSGRGGSSYLLGLSINNPIEFILISPIKMIYFLISPVPWDWRGISDVISFTTDSLIYLVICIYPLVNFKRLIKGDPLVLSIFIMLLSTILIFGIGITNAGTAMRHRYKVFYMLIILFFILKNKKGLLNQQKKYL